MCHLYLLHTIEDVDCDALGVFVRTPTYVGTGVPLLATLHRQDADQRPPGHLLLELVDVGPVAPLRVILPDL